MPFGDLPFGDGLLPLPFLGDDLLFLATAGNASPPAARLLPPDAIGLALALGLWLELPPALAPPLELLEALPALSGAPPPPSAPPKKAVISRCSMWG